MIKTPWENAFVYVWVPAALAVIAIAAGCTTPSSPALEQARLTYSLAERDPEITSRAPVALSEAEQALRRAEQAWADEHDPDEAEHLAYLVNRKVETARVIAERKKAEAEIEQLGGARQDVLLGAARQRAAQAEKELAELKAKQTDRGMVLTLGDVLFETGRAELKPGALRNLYPLVAFMQENPDRNVLIEGYTDSVGSASYNIGLSERRAESVRTFLLQQGISPARMIANGYGKDYPVATNSTEAGRQQNRRVEIVILRAGEAGARRMR